jgi:CRP-like cAMP-binding protein
VDATRIRLLQGMPIFGGTSEEILRLLLERSSTASVARGDLFFREGDAGSSAFVLEAGRVSILKGGRNHVLGEYALGDCFGEVALIDFCPRSATVRADEDCRAIELSAAVLREIQRRDLEQFTLIYMNMARELARRLRVADERLFRLEVAAEPVAESYSFQP